MDGYFPTLVSKDKDANLVTNPIFVKITDGAAAIGVTGNALDVNVTGGSVTVSGTVTADTNFDYAEDSAHSSGDVGAFVMGVRSDAGAALAADGDYIPFMMDANGALYVNVSGISFTYDYAEDTGHTTGDVGAFVLAVRNDTYAALAGTDKDYIPFMVNASGGLYVDIASQTLTALKISKDANANTETNPIFVKVVDTVISGVEIHDYDTTVGVSTTDNHDYTVTGATMLVESIIVASSGGLKFTLQTGPLASLVTKAVGFIPKHGGVTQLFFKPAIEVPVASTGTVRIIRENRESSAQDVYSTIIGNNV